MGLHSEIPRKKAMLSSLQLNIFVLLLYSIQTSTVGKEKRSELSSNQDEGFFLSLPLISFFALCPSIPLSHYLSLPFSLFVSHTLSLFLSLSLSLYSAYLLIFLVDNKGNNSSSKCFRKPCGLTWSDRMVRILH
jgi:hypothetical protein